MSNSKVEATFHDGGNHTPQRPSENAAEPRRCPDGECFMAWHSPAGTAFSIPICQICNRINGYALQDALNDLLERERFWVTERMRELLNSIPPGQRYKWKAVDSDMIFLAKANALVDQLKAEGDKRR